MAQGVRFLRAHFIELLQLAQALLNFGVSLGAEKVGKHFTFFGGPILSFFFFQSILSLCIIHTSI